MPKYQIAVSLVGEGTRYIVVKTRQQAARVAMVIIWSHAPDRAFSEADFLLTRWTTSISWSSSDRSFSISITRI